MARQMTAWVVLAAFVAALALPVLAQTTGTTPPPAPAAPAAKSEPPKTEAAKPAAKPAAKAKTASGTVKSASADSLVVLDKDKKEWTFALSKDTKITKGGKAVEAKDLAENDPVTVRYTEAEGKMTATAVTARTVKAATKKPQS